MNFPTDCRIILRCLSSADVLQRRLKWEDERQWTAIADLKTDGLDAIQATIPGSDLRKPLNFSVQVVR
jgi:hypothetical protein